MKRRWLASLAGMISLVCPVHTGFASFLAATEAEVPLLFPEQEKVVYLPLEGSSAAVEEIRPKEVHGIARFLRKQGLVATPAMTSALAPEVYLQIEPMLIQEAQREACGDAPEVSPQTLLLDAQARFQTGDTEGARAQLALARQALPCWQERASRSFAAELLVWSGLTHLNPESETALGWMRAGLSTDPLLTESPKLPEAAVKYLRKVYADMEYVAQVDLHLPQSRGSVWSHENLILNGRRLVMDKLFLQLPPGIHFLQVVLPDGQLWGTFVDLRPGGNTELAAVIREAFELPQRYRQQIARVLSEGYASPGLLQGFKVYAIKLAREQFYLAAITLESDGPWVTVRRYQMDRGIEVPEADGLKTEAGYTASVPISLSRPWAVALSADYAVLLAQDPGFVSHGSGLDLAFTYRLTPSLHAGVFAGLGARLYDQSSDGAGGSTVADMDATGGAVVGLSLPLGSKVRLLPAVGYIAHLNRFRGLPIACVATDSTYGSFTCGDDLQDDPESHVFFVRGKGSGPLARLTAQLAPLGNGAFTLRSLLRVGYSPLLVYLPESTTVMLTTEDAAGAKETTPVDIAVDAGSQFRLLHQVTFSAGLHGTY